MNALLPSWSFLNFFVKKCYHTALNHYNLLGMNFFSQFSPVTSKNYPTSDWFDFTEKLQRLNYN